MSIDPDIPICCCHPGCKESVDWTGTYMCSDCDARFCAEHLNANQLCLTCEEYKSGSSKALRQFKVVNLAWTHYADLVKLLNKQGAPGYDWKPVAFNPEELKVNDAPGHMRIICVLFMRERLSKQPSRLRVFWRWLFYKQEQNNV